MTINPSEATSDEGEPALAAQCIAALLARHGIPKYRFAVTVSEILGLSYSAGNRRLTTAALWSLEELKRRGEPWQGRPNFCDANTPPTAVINALLWRLAQESGNTALPLFEQLPEEVP